MSEHKNHTKEPAKHSIPELLAPAGSPEAFHAAVAAGADAVYLGGQRFGARHFASNFTEISLAEVVDFAHIREIRVYITMNTLIHDDEIQDFLHDLLYLCTIGVDAILIQDIGMLTLIKELFKDLDGVPALHASTQMAIHNREGAGYAAELGCSRIVLARELPAVQIRDIVHFLKEKNVGVEIFGHGALCYAFSGQCLLSSVIGGRSGNRGMCAQPCRKPYDIVKGFPDSSGRLADPEVVHHTEKYLLSTRDLSLYPVLEKLSDLQVASIKIEGRMRSVQYVATVTGIYRRALDAMKTGHFTPTEDEQIQLALAYSRGFTTGYITGESYQSIMGRDLPGKRGILIGTIIKIDQNQGFTLESTGTLIPQRGDGLVCIGSHGENGLVMHKDARITGTKIRCESASVCHIKDAVYLTSRESMNRATDELLKNLDKRFLSGNILDLRMTINDDGSIMITCMGETRLGRQITLTFPSSHRFSPARSQPLSPSRIADAIRKTGGTRYSIRNIEVISPDGIFVPVSILNAIRREIFDTIDEYLKKLNRPTAPILDIIRERIRDTKLSRSSNDKRCTEDEKPLQIITIVPDAGSCLAALSSGTDRAYVEWYPEEDHKTAIGKLQEIFNVSNSKPDFKNRTGIKLPKILFRQELDFLYEILPDLAAGGIFHILVDGHGLKDELMSRNPGLLISGYTGLNITNRYSMKACMNYDFMTLSCELSGYEIKKTMETAKKAGIDTPVAVLSQGLIESMITCDNLSELIPPDDPATHVTGIRDQKGFIFPFFTDPSGKTHIFNGAETTLIDKIPDIRKTGISILIIDGRMRTPEYISNMVKIYRRAVETPEHEWTSEFAASLKEEVRRLAWGDLTAATWKRGLTKTEDTRYVHTRDHHKPFL